MRAAPRVAPARPDERWRVGERGRRWSAIAVAILVASLVLHGAIVLVAMLMAPADIVPPREIPVEIVQEAPPQAEKPPLRPAVPPPPVQPAPDPAEQSRAGLEKQLAALEAEKKALTAGAEGRGPMRDSMRALALPSIAADGDGEAMDYETLVFSQLAKAKEHVASRTVGGTVGVRFLVDENGDLAGVTVAVSSGVPSLDAEAMEIVRRAAPFPKPPAGAERAFSANVAYAGPER